MRPPEYPPVRTTVEERGKIIIDLLLLADAYPEWPRREWDAPTFKQLCDRT